MLRKIPVFPVPLHLSREYDIIIMICQRPAHKARGLLWEFVAGKVEPGETKEQALIRECHEELAIILSVGDCSWT